MASDTKPGARLTADPQEVRSPTLEFALVQHWLGGMGMADAC